MNVASVAPPSRHSTGKQIYSFAACANSLARSISAGGIWQDKMMSAVIDR
jgi:hypothetical protein